jgi:hypothetical protein
MLASITTAINGWDVLAALVVVLVAYLIERPQSFTRADVWPVLTLFGVAILVFSIQVKW